MKTGRGALPRARDADFFGGSGIHRRSSELRKFAAPSRWMSRPSAQGRFRSDTPGLLRPQRQPRRSPPEPSAAPKPNVRRRRIRLPWSQLPRPKPRTAGSSITPTGFSRGSSTIWRCRNTKNFSGNIQALPAGPALISISRECYRALNRTAAARTSFQSVLDNHGDSEFAGPAAYGVAEILFNQKDYAGALPLFHRSAAKSKEPALALSARYFEARCLENLDRKDEAQNLYHAGRRGKKSESVSRRCAAWRRARSRWRAGEKRRRSESTKRWRTKPEAGLKGGSDGARRDGRG